MAPSTAFVAGAPGRSLFTPPARLGAAACRGASTPAAAAAATRMAAAPDAATRVAAAAAAAILAAAALTAPPPPAAALTAADIRSLTYEQVKGTGLANRCPEVDVSKGSIPLSSGKAYKLVDMCLEPKTFLVEEEVGGKRGEVRKAFVDTKLMTRATYTLTGIDGKLYSDGSSVTFEEQGGIDYAATTVQLPGGERVPFLFTVKALKAVAGGGDITTATEFGGDFKVPSYRSGLFLDPKGRGGTTGYDMAVALPAMQADGSEGQDELAKETNKVFQVTDGEIEMAVNKIDPASGEIAGVFVSEQLSDTDMGAKAPKKILLKGVFYARVEEQ